MQITNTIDLLQNYAYQNDFTFFESSAPQTVNVYLKVNGLYRVDIVGAGGGADGGCYFKGRHGSRGKHYTRHQPGRGGGSGAAFSGNVYLPKGSYQIIVGGGGAGGPYAHAKGGNRGSGGGLSSLSMNGSKLIINCTGGAGASASSCSYGGSHPGTPGSGGIVSVANDLIIKDLMLKSNGLPGNGGAGGNSVYSGTSYGKGGNANSSPGNNGYVRIMLL